jgi:diadenosine tetraphosphate (Ap4A) HIT family hydrolase
MFELHPQLIKDTITIGDFPLCRLLLINDNNYPWFVLVPRRPKIKEIFELEEVDQIQLLKESSQLSQVLVKIFQADKLNVAALGNMVPQLHIHHIVRYQDDQAWPKPVWGLFPAQAYTERALQEVCGNVAALLSDFTPDSSGALAPRVC